jgi:fatty-acyl-CoA synthase
MFSNDVSTLSYMQRWLAHAPATPVFRVGDIAISRGELLAASQVAARYLRSLGFDRGDVICMLLPDSAAWLQFLFAASQIGVLIVPVSTRYRANEIAGVMDTARPKGVIYIRKFLNANFENLIEPFLPTLPSVKHVIALDDAEGLFIPPRPAINIWAPRPDSAALLCTFSTSGTTGRPKLAAHSQAGIAKHAEDVAKTLELDESAVMLGALPLYGVLGFVSAMATIAGGGCYVSQPVFKPESAAQIIDAFGVTHFYGSDGLLDAVLRVPGHRFSTLQRGGFAEFAGLGLRLIEYAESQFGLKLCGIYGSSECFALMALRDPSLPIETRALPGGAPASSDVSFRVIDVGTGERQAERKPGELQIKGPNVMAGYLHNPEATADAMTNDGWFRTGDLAYADKSGFVFLSRMKDSLRLRGYLVDPTEIETFLTTHGSVEAAQVVGVYREGQGDVAVAFICRCNGATSSEHDILAYCVNGVANYKVPSRVIFVEQFPTIAGPNGVKIQKNKLREMAEALVEQGDAP